MGFIIWIIGLVLCIKAVLEILKWNIDGIKKLLVVINKLQPTATQKRTSTTSEPPQHETRC